MLLTLDGIGPGRYALYVIGAVTAIFLLLPIVFTYMLSAFPAGLVIYWAWNNLLSIAQQWTIMHRAGAA